LTPTVHHTVAMTAAIMATPTTFSALSSSMLTLLPWPATTGAASRRL
jgi:hypothetical protein